MEGISLWFFHSLGFYLGMLRTAVLSDNGLDRHAVVIEHALSILKSFRDTKIPVLAKSKKATDGLIAAIEEFSSIGTPNRKATIEEWSPLIDAMDRFQNVAEQEMLDTYTLCITEVGAYSTTALFENAHVHLSKLAQKIIPAAEKKDYQLAGKCLALDLHTASGFHAMRALETEAREYHEIVTGVRMDDVPLGALLSGDKNYKGSGLFPKWVLEGSDKDSPLGLIISLLTHINKIYRCPIMHPEMILDGENARLVFNLSSVAISAMIEDLANRYTKTQQAITTQP